MHVLKLSKIGRSAAIFTTYKTYFALLLENYRREHFCLKYITSLIWTFCNFYIVQNGQSAAIFTTKCHCISPKLIESHQISESHRISSDLAKISPYLIRYHRISQNVNFIEAYKISPYLTESHTKCQNMTSCGTIFGRGRGGG